MKIIATTTSNGFLIEATSDELAQIMGFGSHYSLKEGNKLEINKVIQVTPLWRALTVSRERKAEITALAIQLRKTADRVDTINQALAEPIVEVKS